MGFRRIFIPSALQLIYAIAQVFRYGFRKHQFALAFNIGKIKPVTVPRVIRIQFYCTTVFTIAEENKLDAVKADQTLVIVGSSSDSLPTSQKVVQSRQVKGPRIDMRVNAKVRRSAQQESLALLIACTSVQENLTSLVYLALCDATGLHSSKRIKQLGATVSQAGISWVNRVFNIAFQHLLQKGVAFAQFGRIRSIFATTCESEASRSEKESHACFK